MKNIKLTLYLLSFLFLLILSILFVDAVSNFFKGPVFLLPFLMFSISGLYLFIQRKKIKKQRLQKSITVCAISAAAIFPSIVLHNLISALGVTYFAANFPDEPVFLILGSVVFPVLFIVFLLRTYIIIFKSRKIND